MIRKLFDYLNAPKFPYTAWTLYSSSRKRKAGGFVEFELRYTLYTDLARNWRHTLKDLAEFVGGP